jgi:hypothetical protein
MMPGPDATPPLAAGQIEIWKKIVDVQQHFNDPNCASATSR